MKFSVAVLAPLGAGMLFCVLLSLATGNGPFALMTTIGQGAWDGAQNAASTVVKVTPLLLSGLAVSLAYHAGLLNIGAEGQLTLGALAAAVVGCAAGALPPILLAPLTLLAGAAVGGLWALPAVWLQEKRGVHEVITCLLFNYIAAYLADFLAQGPLGDGSAMARTPLIADGAVWPCLARFGGVGVTFAPFAAVLLALLVHAWLTRTAWGFEMMASGTNPFAARAAGVPVSAWRRRAFAASGAIAGLAGAFEVVAVHHRFYAAFSPGYGFDGIAVAFLAGNAPGWLWASSLLLASLRSTDKWLQIILGMSPNAITLIEAVLLLAVVSRTGWERLAASVASRISARGGPGPDAPPDVPSVAEERGR